VKPGNVRLRGGCTLGTLVDTVAGGAVALKPRGIVGNSGDRFDRRVFLARGMTTAAGMAFAAAGGSLLTACSSTEPVARSPSLFPGVSGQRPRLGGTLTVGVNSEVGGFLPSQNNFDNTGTIYADTVFDTLTKVGADGAIHPNLATEVTPNPDRTAWTVTLRQGVRFHDGTPLDADVVAANFSALKGGLLTGLALSPIKSVAKVDDFTVRYTCEEPLVAFPAYLTTQVGYIVARSQLTDSQGTARPVGTGPFRFVSWDPNAHFSVERNPDYWRSGLPHLDGITFRPIVDDSSRQASLLSGGIDMMVSRNPAAMVDLGGNSAYQQVTNLHDGVGQPDMDYIILNTSVDPLDDLTVRQALAHATDVSQLLKVVGSGAVPPDTSMFPIGSPYRAADSGYPAYDLTKAKRLVAEAAPRHGGKLTLSLGTIPDSRLETAVQALQSMWGKAGFDVSAGVVAQGVLIANMAAGKFQSYTDEGFSAPDPDLNYVWLSPTTAGSPGGFALNFARNKDPAIETALQQGRTNPDRAARVEAYQNIDKLLAKDLPYLWLSQAPWSVTARAGVMNFANPILPDGTRGHGFASGTFTPTQIWLSA